MEIYKVQPIGLHPSISVTVPGSKSITNRALLMAAMAKGDTLLRGVLFSDDSRCFLKALQDLGFEIAVDEKKKTVQVKGLGGSIPVSHAEISVGSAGTAARFLTAFVAMSDGDYILNSSEQMKKRPMKELLTGLRDLGAEIICLEQDDTFPLNIRGIGFGQRKSFRIQKEKEVSINIDRSSQFLSALLMTAPIRFDALTISLTGSRNARSYVEMTQQMMHQFGHPGVLHHSRNSYQVKQGEYQSREYQIEPDISAACYFYAAAAISGGSAVVQHVREESLQGDMKFLEMLGRMGCILDWDQNGLRMTGPEPGKLKGIQADMSDFSDQALTLAAIAPYTSEPVTVQGVEHIRGQESDRIDAVTSAMERMQIRCQEYPDGFKIYPGIPRPAQIETYDDHRVAMAFAVTGLMAEGIEIKNPSCCRKTFENYFNILDQLTGNAGSYLSSK